MVPVLIIGGIRLGIFTATEAASSAIVYALLIGFFWYRTLSLRAVWDSLKSTGEGSASILLLIGASALFAWILVAEQVPQALSQLLVQWTDSKTAVLLSSEEHTSELQSLMRISYAVFCLKNKKHYNIRTHQHHTNY